MLTCQLYIFFGEVSVKLFGPFFNCVVCFLIVELTTLCIFGGFLFWFVIYLFIYLFIYLAVSGLS